MDNINIYKLNLSEGYAGEGVKFNNNSSSFYYWHHDNQAKIEQINIIFHGNDGNIKLEENSAILCLQGLTTPEEIEKAIAIFMNIQKNNNIKVQFIVNNREEQKIAMKVAIDMHLNYQLQYKNAPQEKAEDKLEQKIKNSQELSARGSETMTYNNNGQVKKVTIHNGVALEDNNSLSIQEQRKRILRKWQQDPIMQAKLATLSPEEIEEELMKVIRLEKTAHYLGSPSEQVQTSNRASRVAIDQANKVGGQVNSELGIIQNDNSNNRYSIAEQNGEEMRFVTPEVSQNAINTNSISSTSTINSASGTETVNNQQYPTPENQETNVQTRNVEQVFYLDEEDNIYNEDGNIIGKIGANGYGYMVNWEDNTLLKDGQTIGLVGDYKELGRPKTNVYKPPVLTRKKSPYKSPYQRDAAFVSLPLIIFIISAILLIASGVLLFVLD